MRGHYRFLQTKGGRCYFADVCVDIQLGGQTMEAVDALAERVDPDNGEVNRQTAPTWVAAVFEGVLAALAHAQRMRVLTSGCRVVLQKIIGSVIDTREDTVRCAAGLAVWEALGSPAGAPEPEFDGQRWNLVFPVSVASPVQGISR